MKRKLMLILLSIFVVISSMTNAKTNQSNDFSIDVQNIPLGDALSIIAKFLHQNVIIREGITSPVSLHLHHVSAQKLFTMLLTSHHLVVIPLGNAWFITQGREWMQRQQEQFKLHEAIAASAPMITRVWQIHYAKADDVARVLQDNTRSLLSKRGHVHVDARTNIVCVQDIAEHMKAIEYLIAKIDVPIKQVVIETHLASIDSDFERKLGIHFGVKSLGDNAAPTALASSRYGLLIAKLADGTQLDVQLSALENAGHGQLISSPRLFTANQQTAAIESGEEIPYQEESPSGGTVVVFKKAVLSLKVTPQILPGNKVLLQLQVNRDKPGKLVIQGVPAINTHQISTNVLLEDGQTVVLGGIYESDNEHAKQSIPFLGEIPILGLLFQQNNMVENKRELLVFVTPRVIG